MTPPVALTIAGSDSSGGAGVQADLKTFAALGVYGASAITALTAQNTLGVRGVYAVPAEFVVAQVETALDDLTVAAVKTGMPATAATVRAVADLAAAGRLPLLVVDPVMVATSGDRLLETPAEQLYREALLPYAFVATPNLHEAEVLLGRPIRTLDEQHEAARDLGGLGPQTVVVKDGHSVTGIEGEAADVVWDGLTTYELRAVWVETGNNHGSGCTFASAIAAGLARGLDVSAALLLARTYASQALAGGAGWQVGSGHGPLDHFGHADAPRVRPGACRCTLSTKAPGDNRCSSCRSCDLGRDRSRLSRPVVLDLAGVQVDEREPGRGERRVCARGASRGR